MAHRDLVHTYSVKRRVTIYTIPVVIMAIIINIPKFLETKVVRNMTIGQDDNKSEPYNFTTYTIDVTDLRYVFDREDTFSRKSAPTYLLTKYLHIKYLILAKIAL